MMGVQAVKNHKHVWHGMDQSVIDNAILLTTGVGVFAHVCEQTFDNLSNYRDNNNIHSVIWMKL